MVTWISLVFPSYLLPLFLVTTLNRSTQFILPLAEQDGEGGMDGMIYSTGALLILDPKGAIATKHTKSQMDYNIETP